MNRCAHFLIAIIAFILPAMDVSAIEHPQFAQRHWTAANGLPTNNLQALCQTRDGYLWIATDDGLARFDGKTFTVFSTTNSKLPHNSVQALLEDNQGKLWIATRGGLASYHKGIFQSFKSEKGKANNAINDLAYEAPATLWIGTEEGLNLFDMETGTFQTLTVQDGLPSNLCSRVHLDQSGRLWVVTPNGVLQRNGKESRVFTTADGLLANRILAFQESEQGLWLGGTGGVNLFQNGVLKTPQDIPSGILCSLLLDRKNRLWMGYGKQVVALYGGRELQTFTGITGTMDSLEDRDGNLWFATFGAGLYSLTPSRVSNLFVGEQPSEALTVFESPSQGLLVSTRSGLYRRVGARFETLHPFSNVSALAENSRGELIVGTFSEGVKILNGAGHKSITTGDGLPSNFVHSILAASDGDVWIGTALGPAVLETSGRLRSFSNELQGRVFTITEDATHGIWMGTEGRGLVRHKDGKLQSFEEKDGFGAETVVSLYAESNNTVWIGTDGSGLYRYRSGKFSQYRTQDGLFHDRIFQILDDRKGNLWMGTNRGIFRVRKIDLNDFADKKISSFISAHYNETDGMLNSECMTNTQPSAWRLQNDLLYFGTSQGIAVIDPERLVSNLLPTPQVFVESIQAAGKSMEPGGEILLPPGRGDLVIKMSAFSFGASSEVYLRHKLENWDKEWVNTKQGTASYTNLPHGPYRFLVQARSKDGFWTAESLNFPVAVEPFFYQRKSFYAGSALALLAFVGVLLTLRTRRLVRQNEQLEARIRERTSALQDTARETAVLEERNRIAQELHDSLAQSLTAIVLQIQTALSRLYEQDGQVRELLLTAKKTARESLEETRRSVQALHPLLLERTDFQQAIREIARKMSLGSHIGVTCEFIGNPIVLTKHTEMNLLRIVQEGLSNAIRHSKARNIAIRLTYAVNQVELSVQDDGVGFDPRLESPEFDGTFGLVNIRQRADSIGAALLLSSSPGSGTTIHCTLPLITPPENIS